MEKFDRIDVYLGKASDMKLVKISDFAEFKKTEPEDLWGDNYYLFRCILESKILGKNWPVSVLASSKKEDYFWMDRNGNEIANNEDKTGFCVNGVEGMNLGTWGDIFIPIIFAKKIDSQFLFRGFEDTDEG